MEKEVGSLEQNTHKLQQMGFDAESSGIALKYALNNLTLAIDILESAKQKRTVTRVPKFAMETFNEEDFTARLGIIYGHIKLVRHDLLAFVHLYTELENVEKALRKYHPELISVLCTKFEDLNTVFSSHEEKELPVKDEALFYTVRLEIYYGSKIRDYATGFWFRSTRGFKYLVCNKHAIYDDKSARWATKLQFVVHQASTNNKPTSLKVPMNIDDLEKKVIRRKNKKVDLVAISFEWIEKKRNVEIFIKEIVAEQIATTKIFEKVCTTVEEVNMYGYPNGLWDKFHNLPLVRKGITATHPALNVCMEKDKFDRKCGVVDMACWPGSSGSPIFLVKRAPKIDVTYADKTLIVFLGVLCAGPTFGEKTKSLSNNMPEVKENCEDDANSEDELVQAATSLTLSGTASDAMLHLGYYAKAERVVELIEEHEAGVMDFMRRNLWNMWNIAKITHNKTCTSIEFLLFTKKFSATNK